MQCWLMKAEPNSRIEKGKDVKFSIDDLAACPGQKSSWDGVRNPEASKMMREKMRLGDCVLFYHSNCKLPGVAGLATVCREGYPDYTAWDTEHPYFDQKSDKHRPKWYMVDVKFQRKFSHFVPLSYIQKAKDTHHELHATLKDMTLLRRGRLSVQPVSQTEYDTIVHLGDHGWEETGRMDGHSTDEKVGGGVAAARGAPAAVPANGPAIDDSPPSKRRRSDRMSRDVSKKASRVGGRT